MRILNMSLVLKSGNGKVVSIQDGHIMCSDRQTDERTHPRTFANFNIDNDQLYFKIKIGVAGSILEPHTCNFEK